MTCIVGVAKDGKVFIGADSAGVTAAYALWVRADRKVFRNGDFIMGFTSSFRMGQLLAYSLSPPKPREGADLFAFMVTDFISAVRDCLKTGGFATKDREQEAGGEFLVGYRGRLFKVEGDYQVAESVTGFDACGCGEHIALGSMVETDGQEPRARVERALKAAEQFSAGVRGPFHIEATE